MYSVERLDVILYLITILVFFTGVMFVIWVDDIFYHKDRKAVSHAT